MKAYWDSSALVEAFSNSALRARLSSERGHTRRHSLAEVFSALTSGNLSIRVQPDEAAKMIDGLVTDLDFLDLTTDHILEALKNTKRLGVRGGRVHDFLHAIAAEKCQADEVLTLDKNDFNGLTTLRVVSL
jgi:predicted nucleic acid-binding protein